MEQNEKSRSVLHLLYAPRISKGTNKIEVIEDVIELYDVQVSLKLGARRVNRVYIAPQCEEIAYSVDKKGILNFTVPEISIHAMAVIEWKEVSNDED